WIKTSAAYLDKGSGDLRQKSLAEGLGLPFEGFMIFKDYVSHVEHIRSCEELRSKGLYIELGAYQHHVFLDWRFVDSDEWKAVKDSLNGAGVESMQSKYDEIFGEKKEIVAKEVKVKKPREKAVKKEERGKKKVVKKSAPTKKKSSGAKTAAKKTVVKKATVKKTTKPAITKKTTKPKAAVRKKPAAKKSTIGKKAGKRPS
ncbi:MAG: hypothetical protein M1282_19010, partial [Chloroflexi bacterium]|nr:hypothetical protein [Chloroflexota bacterium]